MIDHIAIAQIADMINESRNKYSAGAERAFYESVGRSRTVRLVAFLTSPRIGGRVFHSRTQPACRPHRSDQAACLARP